MTSANLQQWILHPEMLNKETLYELRTLLTRYPFFQSLRLLYLKNLYLLHDVTFGAELRRASIYITDRKLLFQLIEGDDYKLLPGRKSISTTENPIDEESCSDRTSTLINAFLATIPDELISQTGFDYGTDYTPYLLEETLKEEVSGSPRLKGIELIDGFIEKTESESSLKLLSLPDQMSVSEETPIEHDVQESHSEEDEDDSCFTETLAKIYIKQRRYSKALEIIKKLSLKYPKKNAYFADQIRFLEKLIINAKSK